MQHALPLSVVITTYNRPDALAAVVKALFAQTDVDFEIIIADDGSTANTRHCIDSLRAQSPVPVEHVWQPDLGFRAAMARNRGVRAARGDYIVFLDGDCVPQRDFIAQHRKLAQPGYLVTGSRVLLSRALTERVLAKGIDLSGIGALPKIAYRLHGHTNKVLQLLVRLPDIGRVRSGFTFRRIKSCNMGVWRRDLDTVNGFDESFSGWGHEDTDLVMRLYNAGVMRKYGSFATEVMHLWHPEAKRDQESSNKSVVLARQANKTIRAAVGLHGANAG